MPDTTIILVRHGETLPNKERRLIGRTDSPLTKEGVRQAKLIALHLKSYPIDIIYSSPLKRTLVTAREIHRYHKKAPLLKHRFLVERSFGKLEGLSYEEVNSLYPQLIYSETWYYEYFQPPGGERLVDVRRRVEEFLEEIRVGGKTVAIISHGVFIKVLFATLLSLPLPQLSYYWIDNASITLISIDRKNNAQAQFINYRKHLKDEL